MDIPCIYLRDGVTLGAFRGTAAADRPAVEMAENSSTAGSMRIVVFDFSEEDAGHDQDIELMREIAEAAAIPVFAAGNIKRVEDVKKILYAGCAKAILNFDKESNAEMLEEVSKRFGRGKIAVYIPSLEIFEKKKEEIGTYASLILCDRDLEEDLVSETDLPVLSYDRDTDSCRAVQYETGFKPAFEWKDFKRNSDGMIPVVVQEVATDEVLMVAYMNEESFHETMRSGRMTYWSRSRNELWKKGETSGHYQYLRSMWIDCDNDTLLAKVVQKGAACHTGNHSCFYRELASGEMEEKNASRVFEEVYQIILDRQKHPKEGSYTNYLFDKGIDKILKKVGEEASEIIIAAKNPDPQETVYEISDFLYHMLVLMAQKGISLEEITGELANR